MLTVSTKGDYGLLLLSQIALNMQKNITYTSLREVSESKKISLKYLSEIALALKKAGIIRSREGREGGYMLTRAPEKIALIEALEALEGPIALAKCCEREKHCANASSCSIKSTWDAASNHMREFFRNKTLADTLI